MKLAETYVSFLLQLKPLSFRIESETKHSHDYLFIGSCLSMGRKCQFIHLAREDLNQQQIPPNPLSVLTLWPGRVILQQSWSSSPP